MSALVNEGQGLLIALQRNRFPIVSAFWFHYSESLEWRLVIVSHSVDKVGPLAAYGRVQRVLAGTKASRLTLTDIALMSPQSQDYQNLQGLVSSKGRVRTRVPAVIHNSEVFDDTYVYQL